LKSLKKRKNKRLKLKDKLLTNILIMEFKFGGSETNQRTVLGHPSGLFVFYRNVGTFLLLWNACFISAIFSLINSG